MASKDARPSDPVLKGNWFENWTWFPQDASGDLNLCPITSKVCMHCNWICLALATAAHITCGYSETVPCARHTGDPAIANFFLVTFTLASGGLFYEIVWAVSIRYMGLAAMYRDEVVLRKRLRLNIKMMCVFSLLATFYSLLAFDKQFVHSGWLANHHGGNQLVYSVRFMEWTVCAPIVLSISGQLEHTPEGHARNGLIPSSLLTGIYCIISWQGLVVTNVLWGWALIAFAFVSYFAASVEQLAFAWYIKDKGRAGPIRAALIVYLVIMMGIYGVMYLLPIPGWITTTLENKFYCLGDASFKLGTAVMLIISQDVCATVEMRCSAEAIAADLKTFINTASVPIFGVDHEGVIDFLNKKAMEILPQVESEIVGRSLCDIFPEPEREKCKEMMESALAAHSESRELSESATIQTSILAPGQSSGDKCSYATVLELSMSARKSTMGKVTGVTLVGHDISAQMQADERKARFMATMSHELRSPLHGIIGLAEFLSKEDVDRSERGTSLQMIARCAKRLLDLVVDIMDMASLTMKNGSAKVKPAVLHRDPVDLAKVIEEVLTLVKCSEDKLGKPVVKPDVQLVNNLTPLPIIVADAAKCTQVFYNLITNACKFTAQGNIVVSCRRLMEFVEVDISDTGTGISAQNLTRIFQPFEQEDNTTTRAHDGIGLGLAIAHEVVRAHGGKINVTSKLGAGTTFTVRLPVADSDKQAGDVKNTASPRLSKARGNDTPAAVPAEATQIKFAPREQKVTQCVKGTPVLAPSRRSGKPVILSVDDELVNQMVMEKLLRNDYKVFRALDGEEACEFFRNNPSPDLVLLDRMMPGMDGMQVLKFLRQELKLSTLDVPVLMVSAADQDVAKVEALSLGCNDYITKPFEGTLLMARIKAALAAKEEYMNKIEAIGGLLPEAPTLQPSKPDGCVGALLSCGRFGR